MLKSLRDIPWSKINQHTPWYSAKLLSKICPAKVMTFTSYSNSTLLTVLRRVVNERPRLWLFCPSFDDLNSFFLLSQTSRVSSAHSPYSFYFVILSNTRRKFISMQTFISPCMFAFVLNILIIGAEGHLMHVQMSTDLRCIQHVSRW